MPNKTFRIGIGPSDHLICNPAIENASESADNASWYSGLLSFSWIFRLYDFTADAFENLPLTGNAA